MAMLLSHRPPRRAAVPAAARDRALRAGHPVSGDRRQPSRDRELRTRHPLFQAVHEANPGDGEVETVLALCHKRLGAILDERRQRRRSSTCGRRWSSTKRASRRTRMLRGSGATSRCRTSSSGFALLGSGDPRAGLAAYGRALALREDLVRDDPRNVQAPHDLASVLWYIGIGREHSSATGRRRSRHLKPPEPFFKVLMSDRDDLPAQIDTGLADSYEGLGRLNDALRLRRQALERHRALLQHQPRIKTLRRAVARSQSALGTTLGRLADRQPDAVRRLRWWREGCDAFDEALRVSAGLESDGQFEPADTALREELRSRLARCERGLTSARVSSR